MTMYDIYLTAIDGQPLKLDAYRGRALLIVNVASKCKFTEQYAGLEDLYQHWKDKGLVVLGFPCNQFGRQEPGDEAAIDRFCSLTYNVTFPMFEKIDVNGPETHPLFRHLKTAKRGTLWTKSIKWNFTKFLVNPEGTVVRRYGPTVSPKRIEKDLAPLFRIIHHGDTEHTEKTKNHENDEH